MIEEKPEQALRYNKDKLPLELVPPSLEIAFALVTQAGMKKYPARNWEKGMNWSIIVGCIKRHLSKFLQNSEALDPETGLPELYHVLWNIGALVEFRDTHPEMNDLNKPLREPLKVSPLSEPLKIPLKIETIEINNSRTNHVGGCL